MKTITTEFDTQIVTAGKRNDAKVFYDSETVEPERLRFKFDGSIFGTSMSELEVDIKDCPNLIDKTISAEYGLLVGEEYEYITWNDYFVYISLS